MTQTTRTEWDLILKIGDNEYRCANHTSSFAINRIPLGSATLAVGRDTKTLQDAMIHATANNLNVMQEATVMLRPKGHWASWRHLDGDTSFDDGLWTSAGEQVIFRGYFTGLGVQKKRGQLRVSAQLIHWLSDLAFSSIFSNQSHPENPSKYTFQATYPKSLGGGTAGKPDFIGGTRFKKHISQGAIKSDLWKALANVFCEIADKDLIRLGSPGKCGGIDAPNSQSLEALKRIEGGHDCADNPNNWHKPLSLAGPDMGGLIADAIRKYIAQQSLNSWWSTTLWDKLVHDFAPSFFFHIVPRVETAIVAPFVPGLRDSYRVSLEPEDGSAVDITSFLRRPLRGVGIYAGREVRTVATDRKEGEITNQMGIGGCFMPDPEAKGMVMLKRAPFWLTNVPAISTKPSQTLAGKSNGGGRQPTSTSTTPQDGSAAASQSAAERAIESADLYDRLAQYLYVQEVLRGRNGVLSGKLRYDVAPGANVVFHTTSGIHQEQDQLADKFYASVMRVSCAVDAEMGRGGTTFALAHIRSDAENMEDRTSVDSHPLYEGQKFLGAPLVDEYLFDT